MTPRTKAFKALKGIFFEETSAFPSDPELPIVTLRVQILEASNLLAKDRNGSSDPFFVVSCLSVKHKTRVIKKTLDPSFPEKDATFDFDIYLSVVDKPPVVRLIAWNKGTLSKDYLGEAVLSLKDWFQGVPAGRKYAWKDTQPFGVSLESTRENTKSQGSIRVKLGFVRPQNTRLFMEFSDIYAEIVNRSRPSVVPPMEGIGTVGSNVGITDFQDDGLLSDDEDDLPMVAEDLTSTTDAGGKEKISTPPSEPAGGFLKSFLGKRRQLSYEDSHNPKVPTDSSASTLSPPGPTKTQDAKGKKHKPIQPRKAGGRCHFNSENEVLGVVILEVKGAHDLPKLSNMTKTGRNMDPCVRISFGKKVFRTRVIRDSLSPVWDEKLMFHVRRYELKFKIQFSVLGWDELSSDDHIGDATLDLAESLQKVPNTAADEDGIHDLGDSKLRLVMPKDLGADPKYKHELTFSTKYRSYDALRQRFWCQYLKQYDADGSGSVGWFEITSMLDSLGSTLSSQTIYSFFTRFGKNPFEGFIEISQAVQCLESEMRRPPSERMHVAPSQNEADPPRLGTTDLSDPSDAQPDARGKGSKSELSTPQQTEGANDVADPGSSEPGHSARQPFTPPEDVGAESSSRRSEEAHERVINIENCPLCHRPRLNLKAEVDIVTHIALCASQDWGRVDKIAVGNFVTAREAQRRLYTKSIGKSPAGDYRLGADYTNIIVKNRVTGQLEEEKMQVYVRLGIRLLYESQMEDNKVESLLRSMSVMQGIKYDAPESVKDIRPFIEFHNLNMDEILDPLDSFKNFNEFIYRKLKSDARPVDNPDDPNRVVSGADCRLIVFESVNEATQIWVKDREFSVTRLLGQTYADQVERYNGGALCILRLAPQDYHRFHSPVDGKIGKIACIPGEYYTASPQAIRTTLDVYGENTRKVVPIDSPQFGRVFAVCIGAMMADTIKITVEEDQEVKRGDEFVYFAFGGSTVVVLFERGVVMWDEDLLTNKSDDLETLVRVGMGIGKGARSSEDHGT